MQLGLASRRMGELMRRIFIAVISWIAQIEWIQGINHTLESTGGYRGICGDLQQTHSPGKRVLSDISATPM